jgi:hypothetical protein
MLPSSSSTFSRTTASTLSSGRLLADETVVSNRTGCTAKSSLIALPPLWLTSPEDRWLAWLFALQREDRVDARSAAGRHD